MTLRLLYWLWSAIHTFTRVLSNKVSSRIKFYNDQSKHC